MRSTLSTVVALASSLQLASAGWSDAPSFSCPANTNNQCNSQQSSGFDWSGLSYGSFSTYGDFDFEGFTCASTFGGGSKRDLLSGRSFQNTCITGKASSDYSSCPRIGCGSSSSVSAFSITEVQISVEFDCDIEFHYEMPDSTTCKHRSSCSSGGSIVKNTQCGGAKNVTVVYPSQSSGSGTTKSSCSIGLHSIGFDCSSASSTKYHSTSTTPVKYTTSIPTLTTSTTKAVVTTPSSSPAVYTPSSSPAVSTSSSPKKTPSSSPAVSTSSSPAVYTPSSSPAVSTSSSSPAVNTSSSSPAATTSTHQVETTSSTPQVTPSSPAASPSTSIYEVITTVETTISTTVCPVTLTHTTGSTTSIEIGTTTSTILLTTTRTVCTKCEQPKSTSSPQGAPTTTSVYVAPTSTTSSGAPVSTASCPSVLPQCLNTWKFIEGCESNTDTDCFCPSTDIVSNVYSCLSAYGASDTEISLAQTYFQGICANYIPSNPAIVTCASSVVATVTQTAVPVTTIQVYTTVEVPCTETTGVSAGFTIPSSYTTATISTQVVVPQVVFTTYATGTSTGAAVLVTGAPTIGNAGVATGTAAGTTVALTGSSNSTAKATATPTQQQTSAAGKNGIAFGAVFASIFFAVMIL